jgi:hypothetical protein
LIKLDAQPVRRQNPSAKVRKTIRLMESNVTRTLTLCKCRRDESR